MVHQTVPLIEDLEHAMLKVRDELVDETPIQPIIRLAAHAALLSIGKYYALTDDCEVYRIAISTSLSH